MIEAPRLLIADDDADMCAWLRAIAEPLGLIVHEARDGAELLARMADYDAVITDDRMPLPFGRSAIGMARACGLEMPILIVSAHGADLTAMVRGLGATDVLMTPVRADDIRSWCVRNIVAIGSPGRASRRTTMQSDRKWYEWTSGDPTEDAAPHSRRDTRPTRIFVAEDDADLRALIAQSLRRDGYEVVEAADGLELLDCLQDALSFPLDMPDVIITDVMMPRYSGLGVLRALRRAKWFTPVIVVSATAEKSLEQARELGATAFLKKPFAIDALRVAVANATLASIRARNALEQDGPEASHGGDRYRS